MHELLAAASLLRTPPEVRTRMAGLPLLVARTAADPRRRRQTIAIAATTVVATAVAAASAALSAFTGIRTACSYLLLRELGVERLLAVDRNGLLDEVL